MKKRHSPYVCERLGVETGEGFRLHGLPHVKFFVREDGTFTTDPPMAPGACFAFLRAVERPGQVVREVVLTDAERAVAGHICQVYGMFELWRDRSGELSFLPADCMAENLPGRMFPSLRAGQGIRAASVGGAVKIVPLGKEG